MPCIFNGPSKDNSLLISLRYTIWCERTTAVLLHLMMFSAVLTQCTTVSDGRTDEPNGHSTYRVCTQCVVRKKRRTASELLFAPRELALHTVNLRI